jgi:hypothetical protein
MRYFGAHIIGSLRALYPDVSLRSVSNDCVAVHVDLYGVIVKFVKDGRRCRVG